MMTNFREMLFKLSIDRRPAEARYRVPCYIHICRLFLKFPLLDRFISCSNMGIHLRTITICSIYFQVCEKREEEKAYDLFIDYTKLLLPPAD